MKRTAAIIVVAMAAGLALGQQAATDAGTVRDQLNATAAQMAALRAQAREAPATIALRQSMTDANAAYEQAVAAIPAVKAVDDQLAAVRAQMRQLMLQREAALKANASQLAAVRQARDAASAQYRQAMMGGEAGAVLMARQRELATLDATQARAAAVATGVSPSQATPAAVGQ